MRKYYEAYDERYKAVHKKNLRWMGYESSPIVTEIIQKYGISKENAFLEIGCGEGRDSIVLLENGYNLLATDVSPEAVSYCKAQYKGYEERFSVLDAVKGKLDKKFDYIEYKSSNGTDFRASLIPESHWCGGGETTLSGNFFNPNLPTEEVFISPKKGFQSCVY